MLVVLLMDVMISEIAHTLMLSAMLLVSTVKKPREHAVDY